MKMTDIHCKVSAATKREAERVFKKLGMNKTHAIRMFLAQVAMTQAIPFIVKIPNQETMKAIEEAEKKTTALKSYASAKDLFKDLDKEDE